MKMSMRDEEVVLEVIDLCAMLEEKAFTIYETLRDLAENQEMRDLWITLAADEKEHNRYWHRLKDVCSAGAVPELFDEPNRYADELRALVTRVDHLAEIVKKDFRAPEVFIHVLRLEFLLLHPSFLFLFHYLPDGPQEVSPSRTYEKHLGRLLTSLMDYRQLTPELELLGETIGQVWKNGEESALRAVLDPLTGTLNRRGLYIAMKPLVYLARRERKRAGVMILEITNLKEINMKFGHKVGDEILAATAKAVSSRFRASDAFGRFGGDDFLAMLTRFDPQFFEGIGCEIVKLVENVSIGEARPILKIGGTHVAIGENVKDQLEALIRGADTALASARSEIKNCFFREL